MEYVCKKMDIKMNQVAYIGDDLNDLELLNAVGLSGCPSNSPIINVFRPNIITKRKGGEGAFREFVDIILNQNPFNKFLFDIFN